MEHEAGADQEVQAGQDARQAFVIAGIESINVVEHYAFIGLLLRHFETKSKNLVTTLPCRTWRRSQGTPLPTPPFQRRATRASNPFCRTSSGDAPSRANGFAVWKFAPRWTASQVRFLGVLLVECPFILTQPPCQPRTACPRMRTPKCGWRVIFPRTGAPNEKRRTQAAGIRFCNRLPPSTRKRNSAVLAMTDRFVLKFTR